MERNTFDPPRRYNGADEHRHRTGQSYWAIAVLAAVAGALIVLVTV